MKFDVARKKAIYLYILVDYFTALIAWVIFWIYRQHVLHLESPEWLPGIRMWSTRDYFIGLILVPCIWILLNYLSGAYFDLYRKSRLRELYRTAIVSFIGALLLGFTAIANDFSTFIYFFKITSLYFLFHFIITSIGRILVLNNIKRKLKRKEYGYNTLIIGGNGKCALAYEELMKSSTADLYKIVGYVNVDDETPDPDSLSIPKLGNRDELASIIHDHDIEEVVIALESKEHQKLESILVQLSYMRLYIKILPDLYDIISGTVKTSNVLDPIFVTIQPELIPDWQKVMKRWIDIIASSFAIMLLSPIYLISAIMVRKSSPGPLLYKQERIGLLGKPFYIYKFRSMYIDAEKSGPALSKTHDPRITPWGRIMRKWRIDELPQFFNILRGEMSLVGPRPERKYFIDQIIRTHPHYKYLHRVKPGLTSWGMVQFGYAENIEQMIVRMKYDLLYIKNCSIFLDLKILIYTFKVLAQGRGK